MYALSDVNQGAIGGVRALLVAPFASEPLYTYATAARATITAITGATGWQRFDLSEAASAQAPGKPSPGGGWRYTHQLDLSAPGLTVARSYVAEQLKASPVLALVQDYAGQWWLLGQQLGLVLREAGWQTGALRGESGQRFGLERTESSAPRRVASSFINLIYNAATPVVAAPTV